MTGASERDWTTAEAIAHGREWLAVGWTWKRGQVAVTPDGQLPVIVRVSVRGVPLACGLETAGGVPDMRDPGTRGHALAQVREAWGDEGMGTESDGMTWAITDGNLDHVAEGDTESETLLAALRAAL